MIFRQKIEDDLKDAMRKKEELRLSVLRMLSAAIRNREIEKRTRLAKASAEHSGTSTRASDRSRSYLRVRVWNVSVASS